MEDCQSSGNTFATLKLYRTQVNVFIELVTDKDSDKLTYDDVDFYKSKLPKIPRNRTKVPDYRNHSLNTLVRKSIDEGQLGLR